MFNYNKSRTRTKDHCPSTGYGLSGSSPIKLILRESKAYSVFTNSPVKNSQIINDQYDQISICI